MTTKRQVYYYDSDHKKWFVAIVEEEGSEGLDLLVYYVAGEPAFKVYDAPEQRKGRSGWADELPEGAELHEIDEEDEGEDEDEGEAEEESAPPSESGPEPEPESLDIELNAMNVEEAKEAVDHIESIEALNTLSELEAHGKNRKTLLAYIAERIEKKSSE